MMVLAPKRRGRPPKNAPPPPTEAEAEGTELEEAPEPDESDDGYVSSILSQEQSAPKRRRSASRERSDD
jgi:hypothetical protein